MDTGGEGGVEQNDVEQRSDLNLSDVLKVLEDADGGAEERAESMAWSPRAPPAQAPYVRIVEQPAPKALRFRYECEGRSAGSILGVNSTPERKTYPTIEIGGYTGTVLVVVCCVTCDEPYQPHPHKLVGNDCQNGVHSVRSEITPENRTVTFTKLGVQCVKRKDVAEALLQRERAKIDPFRTGYEHRNNPQSINLNAVRLCFHVYLENPSGKYRHTLRPVVSDVVYDKKAMSELLISRVSACTGSARGGLQLILLCDKVSRDEITVAFEERNGEAAVWREHAVIDHVHKQYAIVCTVPAYRNPKVAAEVETYLFLERRTDKARSNEIKFKYMPDVEYLAYLNGKKRKILDTRGIESFDRDRPSPPFVQEIKLEPRDAGLRSPQQVMSPPNAYYPDYSQWSGVPAGAVGAYQYGQLVGGMETPGGLRAAATSPHMQVGSPLMNVGSPHMQAPSPHLQVQPSHMQAPSPHMQAQSPHMQAPSPHMQAPSPHLQIMSPTPVTHPGMMPCNLMQQQMQQQQPQQQQQQQQQGGGGGAEPSGELSLTTLLGAGGSAMAFDSAELAGLAFLERGPDLSDSLNRLSTTDLYQ